MLQLDLSEVPAAVAVAAEIPLRLARVEMEDTLRLVVAVVAHLLPVLTLAEAEMAATVMYALLLFFKD